jgi:hypothetical protein
MGSVRRPAFSVLAAVVAAPRKRTQVSSNIDACVDSVTILCTGNLAFCAVNLGGFVCARAARFSTWSCIRGTPS